MMDLNSTVNTIMLLMSMSTYFGFASTCENITKSFSLRLVCEVWEMRVRPGAISVSLSAAKVV